MPDDEEAIKQAESQCRHGKEIHCRNRFTMVVQEGCPSLYRLGTSWRFPHPALHSSLGDIEAEHLQFAMNLRRAPNRILRDPAKDEFAHFLADTSSSHAEPMPRQPRPIQLESRPMPADDGLRLNEDQCPLPFRPEPLQDPPEQLVGYGESRLRVPAFQDAELLAQSEIFEGQVPTESNRTNEQCEQEPQRARHVSVVAKILSVRSRSPIDFATVLNSEDKDGITVVVEAHTVVAAAQAQFWRINVLKALTSHITAARRQTPCRQRVLLLLKERPRPPRSS
jgi:hypothetical protein